MNTRKKIVITVVSILLVVCIAVGAYFALYFARLKKVPERTEVETRSSQFYSYTKTGIFASAPYSDECVFETVEGLDKFWRSNRTAVRGIDIKLQVTKDGSVVVLSEALGTYSDAHIIYKAEKSVSDLTLEELKKVNLAYNFADSNGQMFYKAYAADGNISLVNALTIEEFTSWFNSQRSEFPLFTVSFYDESAVEAPEKAVDAVYKAFSDIDSTEFFAFRTNNKNTATYIDETYPDMLRAATEAEAKALFKSCLSDKKADVSFELIFANSDNGFMGEFSSEKFIVYAKNNNIALILSDVNEASVKTLSSLYVDGIATNKLSDYYEIIKEEYRSRSATK